MTFPLTIHELAAVENESIQDFVRQAGRDGLLSRRVLDYGCGRQPYRAYVEAAGGRYTPFDRVALPGGSVEDVGPEKPLESAAWDAILCTQVVEYVPNVYRLLRDFRDAVVAPGGALVLTYPTVWRELPGDLHRFTKVGMGRLVYAAGWRIERHELRAAVEFTDFELPLGYGLIGRA